MSSVVSEKTNLRGKVFETVLSSPGISEKCKMKGDEREKTNPKQMAAYSSE